jgi:hypothetical protein
MLRILTTFHCYNPKPEGRISHFRNHVRKVAQAHVASHYGLTKGADTKVADLLKKNMFIYPVNSKVCLPYDCIIVSTHVPLMCVG